MVGNEEVSPGVGGTRTHLASLSACIGNRGTGGLPLTWVYYERVVTIQVPANDIHVMGVIRCVAESRRFYCSM